MTAVLHGHGHVFRRRDRRRPPSRQQCARLSGRGGRRARGDPRGLLPILEERLRRDLGDRSAELRAFEIEVDDLAGTLDYPDVLLPDLRVPL